MDKLWITCAQNGDNANLRARRPHFPHVFHRLFHKDRVWISLSDCARERNLRTKSRADVWSHAVGRGRVTAETSAIRVPIFPLGSGHSRPGAATAKPPRSQSACQMMRRPAHEHRTPWPPNRVMMQTPQYTPRGRARTRQAKIRPAAEPSRARDVIGPRGYPGLVT